MAVWPQAGPTSALGQSPRYQGVFRRFVATIVDSILYFVVAWGLAGTFGEIGGDGFSLEGTPAMLLSLAFTAYYVVCEGAFGATLGKLVLGIRVVNREGRAPGIGPALVRNLLRIIDFLPFAYVVGIVAILASKTKQRLGDRVAGTYVVAR